MSCERRTFKDSLEPFIYWDTTFATALTDNRHVFHVDCDAFATHLKDEGCISVTSDFTYNELGFLTIREALAVEGRKVGKHWADVFAGQPDLLQLAVPAMDARLAEIDTATIQIPVPLTVRARAFQLIKDFNLLPTDAYLIAVALEAGVNAFVTLDADFLRVDGVYTCIP